MAPALRELGRLERTLFTLDWIEDLELRRETSRELNKGADPSTLVRAARDFCGKEPKFAATVALLALSSLLAGGGYDPSVSEVDDAVKHLLSASRQIGVLRAFRFTT